MPPDPPSFRDFFFGQFPCLHFNSRLTVSVTLTVLLFGVFTGQSLQFWGHSFLTLQLDSSIVWRVHVAVTSKFYSRLTVSVTLTVLLLGVFTGQSLQF